MTELGYFLSSEEHPPGELVRQARLAEEHGFRSVWISDHFHPWLESQGESPFVWTTIGGIGATTALRVTTAVTCPMVRTHPAIVAHAAATSAVLLDGRFRLGVGTGEWLNEHVLGDRWPPAEVRLEMLEEAVEVMRLLWEGDTVTHRGRYYAVENARLFTCPEGPIEVPVSAFGPKATEVAARIGDGFVTTSPDAENLARYRDLGGRGPAQAGVKVCWGPDEAEARALAHQVWRSSGVPGQLSQDLATPSHFEQASELVTEDAVAGKIPCGPDPERFVEALRPFLDAGFDELYVQQVGGDQEGFFRFFRAEVEPRL